MDNAREEEILIQALFTLIYEVYLLKRRISFRWTHREYWATN